MPAVLSLLKDYVEDGVPGYTFWCPACYTSHWVSAVAGTVMDFVAPTVHTQYVADDSAGSRCHIIISEGLLHYLPDSTHAWAGLSVPMELF